MESQNTDATARYLFETSLGGLTEEEAKSIAQEMQTKKNLVTAQAQKISNLANSLC